MAILSYTLQVRVMVGCLLMVGEGRLSLERLAEMLSNPEWGRDDLTLRIVPAHGLYLTSLQYPDHGERLAVMLCICFCFLIFTHLSWRTRVS